MYSTLSFGPFAFPTAPLFALLAILIGLDVSSRFSRHLDLDANTVWNTGAIAITVGLIIARLWNVFRLWTLYSAEPALIISLRPSGFDLLPGLCAALIAAYAYLLYRALDPLKMLTAISIGIVAALTILAISDLLTGAVVGTSSQQPWAVNYFGKRVHPAALYRAWGFLVVIVALPIISRRIINQRNGSVLPIFLVAALGAALARLVADGFVAEAQAIAGLRVSQILALILALVATWFLARYQTTARNQGTHPPAESVAEPISQST